MMHTYRNIHELAELAQPYLEKWLKENRWKFQLQPPLEETWVDVIPKLNVFDEERVRREADAKFFDRNPLAHGDGLVKKYLNKNGYRQLTSEFWRNELREFIGIISNLKNSNIDFGVMHHESGSYSIWRTGMILDDSMPG